MKKYLVFAFSAVILSQSLAFADSALQGTYTMKSATCASGAPLSDPSEYSMGVQMSFMSENVLKMDLKVSDKCTISMLGTYQTQRNVLGLESTGGQKIGDCSDSSDSSYTTDGGSGQMSVYVLDGSNLTLYQHDSNGSQCKDTTDDYLIVEFTK